MLCVNCYFVYLRDFSYLFYEQRLEYIYGTEHD